MTPNVVIDGRGRFVYKRIIPSDEWGEMNLSELRLVDDTKVSLDVLTAGIEFNTTSSVTKNVVIFNDNQATDYTYTVEFVKMLPVNWTCKVYYKGAEKTTSFDLAVTKKNFGTFQLVFTAPNTSKYNEIGTILIKAYVKDSEENCDMVVGAVATTLIGYTDVEIQFETLMKDASVFPAGVYTTKEIVNQYIKTATELLFKTVTPLWRFSINKTQLAKQYCIFYSIIQTLLRTSVYAYSGATIWLESINLFKSELRMLEERLGE